MVSTLSRDTYLAIGLIFVVLFALFASIPKKADKEAISTPPGNIVATIVWPAGPIDIDLWMDGPGERAPVGYSNKGGSLWNLLRDDLGSSLDITGMNFENGYSRGIIAGDYTINLHCYSCPKLPIVVNVEVAVNLGNNTSMMVIATTKVTLTHKGQEKTALRFTLKESGQIVPGSINAVFKALRSAKK